MIEHFSIRGYRSCLATSMSLQPDLSVLIGPNGSGKTNILNALLLLRKLAIVDPWLQESRKSNDEHTDWCRLTVMFRLNGKTATLFADIQFSTEDGNLDSIVSSSQSWEIESFTGHKKRVFAPLSLPKVVTRSRSGRKLSDGIIEAYLANILGKKTHWEPAFRTPLFEIADFLSGMKYFTASQFTNPSQCPAAFEIENDRPVESYRRTGSQTKFLFDLYRGSTDPETSNYEQFINIVGPHGIGLIDKLEFKRMSISSSEYAVRTGGTFKRQKREKALVIPKFTIGNNKLSPSQLSEGTFKTLALLFYLITQDSNILLIEEPEVCVHYGLLSSIIELLKTKSRKKQIVVSTHSDFILDQCDPRHVYSIERLKKRGTIVKHVEESLSARDLAALRDYLKHEGNLGEYWKHGGLEKIS